VKNRIDSNFELLATRNKKLYTGMETVAWNPETGTFRNMAKI